MTNHPIEYENYRTKELRGVTFAKYNYIEKVSAR